MSLVVVGANHQTCPLAVREKLAFSPGSLPMVLPRLSKHLGGVGAVILSTCNRVEVYAHHPDEAGILYEKIEGFLAEEKGLVPETFRGMLYRLQGREAVLHLFRVASSLDSLVVGEAEILGQVHGAYGAAQGAETTDKVINALFQRAFSAAKDIRTDTKIGLGKVSVSSVAVDLAVSIFRDLNQAGVMVLGSGEMGESTLRSLLAQGAGRVFVVNRNLERARELAERHGGEALGFEVMPGHLHEADIIICSTAAPHYVLRPGHLIDSLARRAHRPVFLIDIAVPRNVDPTVRGLENVYLYDIDDLKEVVRENVAARHEELDRCHRIVERQADQFMRWVGGSIADPAILSMTEELNAIRERELQRTLEALPDLTEEQRQEVCHLSERLVKRILQRSASELKQEVRHHDPGFVLHLVRRLFGLEEGE